MQIRIASYFRNRRERKLKMWCVKMAVRKGVVDSLYYAEEIYRWVKGTSGNKN